MLQLLESGLVYRNPVPHLVARHAWHPSLALLPSGDLRVGFDLGQAVESLDYATFTASSPDGGRTWSDPRRLLEHPWLDQISDTDPAPCTHSIRLGSLPDGSLVGLGGRWHRRNRDEGLVNRQNLGYVPMDLFLVRSHTGGESWSPPEPLAPPLVGPSFELCHRIVELRDGRWLAPTSTWRGWDGSAPHGMQAVALVSHDRGRSWPEYLTISNESAAGVISWETGLAELADGRLVATVWRFDERRGHSLPNRFTVSTDGRTFADPVENGLAGETAKLLALADGRVLCLYRRLDRPGLWGEIARIDGAAWRREAEAPLWRGPQSGLLGRGNASDELSSLRFGYPSAVQLPDGDVLAVFWCVEDCLHVIRWLRLRVAG